jgi:hypothetical protein
MVRPTRLASPNVRGVCRGGFETRRYMAGSSRARVERKRRPGNVEPGFRKGSIRGYDDAIDANRYAGRLNHLRP